MEGDFLNQFTGSASANVVTVLVLAIIYVFKKKCDHSKCKLHNSCIDVELSHSDDTSSKDDQDIQRQVKELVQKMLRRDVEGLPDEHKEGETFV